MTRRLPTIHGITEHDAGPWRMERLDLEFDNGERRRYERLHGRGHGAVIVVPMLDAGTALLVREYAAGVHRYELGLVKGRIDAGETPEQAADRELKEEAGYGARSHGCRPHRSSIHVRRLAFVLDGRLIFVVLCWSFTV